MSHKIRINDNGNGNDCFHLDIMFTTTIHNAAARKVVVSVKTEVLIKHQTVSKLYSSGLDHIYYSLPCSNVNLEEMRGQIRNFID